MNKKKSTPATDTATKDKYARLQSGKTIRLKGKSTPSDDPVTKDETITLPSGKTLRVKKKVTIPQAALLSKIVDAAAGAPISEPGKWVSTWVVAGRRLGHGKTSRKFAWANQPVKVIAVTSAPAPIDAYEAESHTAVSVDPVKAAAAKLRLILDEQEGKPSPDWVKALAALDN